MREHHCSIYVYYISSVSNQVLKEILCIFWFISSFFEFYFNSEMFCAMSFVVGEAEKTSNLRLILRYHNVFYSTFTAIEFHPCGHAKLLVKNGCNVP